MRTTTSLMPATSEPPLVTRVAYLATLTAVVVAALGALGDEAWEGFGWVGGWYLLVIAAGAELVAWERRAASLPPLSPRGAALLRAGCALATLPAWGVLWRLTAWLGPEGWFTAVVAGTLFAPLLVAHALYGAVSRLHPQRRAGGRVPGA